MQAAASKKPRRTREEREAAAIAKQQAELAERQQKLERTVERKRVADAARKLSKTIAQAVDDERWGDAHAAAMELQALVEDVPQWMMPEEPDAAKAPPGPPDPPPAPPGSRVG